MTIRNRTNDFIVKPHGGTAASSFHLSETLDWSSLLSQIKNGVKVLPSPSQGVNEYRTFQTPINPTIKRKNPSSFDD